MVCSLWSFSMTSNDFLTYVMLSEPKPVCVCLRLCVCVYMVCLHLGQCHFKPWVCHRQCQASQRDPGTQRGLRRPTDPPPALSALPQVKGHPALSIPPMKKSLAPRPANSFLLHMLQDYHRGPKRLLNCVLHADRFSWVRGGTSFEVTDNYKGPFLTGSCQYKFPLLISN